MKEQAEKTMDSSVTDSSELASMAQDRLGAFAQAANGEEKFITLENNLMKVKVSTRGGKIYSVELKNYQTYDSLPLILFEGSENLFGLNFFSQNRSIRTDNLFFEPSANQEVLSVNGPEVKKGKEGNEAYNEEHGGDSQLLSMKLSVADGSFLEYEYSLKHNSYMIGFQIKAIGMSDLISANTNYLNFNWAFAGPRLEMKSKYGEDRYTSVNYKYFVITSYSIHYTKLYDAFRLGGLAGDGLPADRLSGGRCLHPHSYNFV